MMCYKNIKAPLFNERIIYNYKTQLYIIFLIAIKLHDQNPFPGMVSTISTWNEG